MDEVPTGKVCTKCGEWKAYSEYYPRRDSPDGHKNDCKLCRRGANATYYQSNQESILAKEHARLPATRTAKREYDQQYREANRERLLAYQRERYIREQKGKPQPERTPEQKAATRRRSRRWRLANPERAKANRLATARRDPERWVSYQQKHRALKRQSGGTVTGAEWRAIKERQHHKCLSCGKRCRLTMDHIVPLSRGGRHAAANLQGLCRPCNSRKHTSIIDYRHGTPIIGAMQPELLEA